MIQIHMLVIFEYQLYKLKNIQNHIGFKIFNLLTFAFFFLGSNLLYKDQIRSDSSKLTHSIPNTVSLKTQEISDIFTKLV